MKKRMLCCLLALVLAVGLLSACGSVKAAVYVQSVAALTGYGSLGGANASSGVVVAQKEIKVDRDSSRKIKQLNVEVARRSSPARSCLPMIWRICSSPSTRPNLRLSR